MIHKQKAILWRFWFSFYVCFTFRVFVCVTTDYYCILVGIKYWLLNFLVSIHPLFLVTLLGQSVAFSIFVSQKNMITNGPYSRIVSFICFWRKIDSPKHIVFDVHGQMTFYFLYTCHSSIVLEVIRTVLFFIKIFYTKIKHTSISTRLKSIIKHTS